MRCARPAHRKTAENPVLRIDILRISRYTKEVSEEMGDDGETDSLWPAENGSALVKGA